VLVILRGIGIYKSDNGGIDWRRVSDEPTLETLHFAPANPVVAYAGAFAQVLKSENEGETWQVLPIPPKAQVYAIATDPDNADLVFAATDRGIVRSSDGGQTWLTLLRGGEAGKQILDGVFYSLVVVKTARGNRVYVAGEGDQIHWRATNDTGSFWQTRICQVCVRAVFALASDPLNSDRLLAGSDEGRLAISTNGGNDWSQTTVPLPSVPALKFSVLKFNPTNPQIVYVGSGTNRNRSDGEGFYRSLDGGLTWQRFNNWASSEGAGTYIQGIALDPTNSQTIFIAGSAGVFRSDDGGNTWVKL
jgi:photosystem II stability/assembly factor-like uncharacterized protein